MILPKHTIIILYISVELYIRGTNKTLKRVKNNEYQESYKKNNTTYS